MMTEEEIKYAKDRFKNHIATFTDYGNIKIIDFKNPESVNYRIRFLFEEDYYKLHITGDLGELVASNYNNMCYESFKDFVDNIGYFKSKIKCHSNDIYEYDYEKAKKDLEERLEECDFTPEDDFESEEELREKKIEEILEDLNTRTGLGSKAYDILSELDPDCFEWIDVVGRVDTNILELYMLAFKQAVKLKKSI